jgi:hypothetical protein
MTSTWETYRCPTVAHVRMQNFRFKIEVPGVTSILISNFGGAAIFERWGSELAGGSG